MLIKIVSGGLLNGLGFRIDDKIIKNTRPMTAIIRKSIFDTVRFLFNNHALTVLDLFAGTGILGFESISNGAKNVIFVEKIGLNCEIIKNHLSIVKKITKNFNSSVIKLDVRKLVDINEIINNIKVDLVFIDPPYDISNYIGELILCEQRFIKLFYNAIVVFRVSSEKNRNFDYLDKILIFWDLLKQNKIGQNIIYFLKVKKV